MIWLSYKTVALEGSNIFMSQITGSGVSSQDGSCDWGLAHHPCIHTHSAAGMWEREQAQYHLPPRI